MGDGGRSKGKRDGEREGERDGGREGGREGGRGGAGPESRSPFPMRCPRREPPRPGRGEGEADLKVGGEPRTSITCLTISFITHVTLTCCRQRLPSTDRMFFQGIQR